MNGRIAVALAAVAFAVLGGCSQTPAPHPPPAESPVAAAPAPPPSKEDAGPSPIDRTGLPPLSDAGVLALKILLQAPRFTGDAVGEGGERPLEVESLRVLFDEKEAKAAFRHLLDDGTLAGRLFGLCGLWYADPAAFEKACATFLEDHGEENVTTFVGCIVEEVPVAGLVRNTESMSVVRLKDRAQTVNQWIDGTKTPDAVYDIAGGGWPCVLRSGGGW